MKNRLRLTALTVCLVVGTAGCVPALIAGGAGAGYAVGRCPKIDCDDVYKNPDSYNKADKACCL